MNVSAVGFLFQDTIKTKGLLKGKNYTCTIHKLIPNGNYTRNISTAPIIEESVQDIVSPEIALDDIKQALARVYTKKVPGSNRSNESKFIGATIKDGIKETEVHSFFFDKLFAIRTKDELGKNHFRFSSRENTQKILANNLNFAV